MKCVPMLWEPTQSVNHNIREYPVNEGITILVIRYTRANKQGNNYCNMYTTVPDPNHTDIIEKSPEYLGIRSDKTTYDCYNGLLSPSSSIRAPQRFRTRGLRLGHTQADAD